MPCRGFMPCLAAPHVGTRDGGRCDAVRYGTGDEDSSRHGTHGTLGCRSYRRGETAYGRKKEGRTILSRGRHYCHVSLNGTS